ncbi:lytic polysaccharide monooxygenase [Nocardia jejuensis]|uniref:lytic polysaccharide monooxygenase n=1 Tax=Nocardia jejuensis TaxID=328049 RepID=UPI00083259F2|nr:lytic polysaccharide monooxygenase [Nocardia jejuensis]
MVGRRLSILGAAGIAPFLVAVMPPGIANAHGYVASPPSRQAQCAQSTVSCGDIKYEPQSVEGPKGLRNCSANIGRFAELDDDSKPWKAQSVGGTVDFTWTFTALHRTLNWEYYIGGTRVGVVEGNNEPPPRSVTHTVNLGNFTGRQKLLAIWNIGDTANAFYSCVDLQIGGDGGTPTTTTPPTTTKPTTAPPTTTAPTTSKPTTAPPATTEPPVTTPPTTTHSHGSTPPQTTTEQPSGSEWKVGARYNTGDIVTYQGKRYKCRQSHTVYDPGWTPTAAPALWQAA